MAAGMVGGLQGCSEVLGQKMTEIRFDLGKNIIDTARATGVPKYQVSNVNGTISYSTHVPPSIPAHYTRRGYEIDWQPLFAFTMWADTKRFDGERVDSAFLQLKRTEQTHAEAQAFVEQTIAQFQRGKWRRYHDSEWHVLLTGRSSLLDESGKIASALLMIDPNYKIPAADWPEVADKGPLWMWVGDGVVATLRVSGQVGTDGLSYSMSLEFELLDYKLQLDAENLARELKEGDAKGWNSTADHEASKRKRAELNKRLVANAIQRGDSVVSAP
jgi:hypothetical protein